MSRLLVACLAVVILAACADGGSSDEGEAVAAAAYPWERPTDDATVEAARQRGEDMVRETAAHLGLELTDADWVDPDQPRVTACDDGTITAQTPFTANVRARVGAATDDADALLAEVEGYWQSHGVEGIDEQFPESSTPSLNGTFDERRWQVSVLVNTDHDFVSLIVNTPCLPSEQWEQR